MSEEKMLQDRPDVFDALSSREKLDYLFQVFQMQGASLYIVGGALRDILTGQTPKDFDLATDARPEEIEAWFEKTVNVGRAFGTCVVVLGDENFEITTFRKESGYADGRHPEDVDYTDDLCEDMRRRDFTINAMYLDQNGVLFDGVGGREDLAAGRIRTVGEPKQRLAEDRLRLWRAIRLAAEKGYEIDGALIDEMILNPKTDNVSTERIESELTRIICSDHPDWGGYLLMRTGVYPSLIRRLLPETDFSSANLMESFERLKGLPADTALRLTALTLWMPDEELIEFLGGLRYPNRIRQDVLSYRRWIDTTERDGIIAFKTMLADLGIERFLNLTRLQERLGEERGDEDLVSSARRGRFSGEEIYLNEEPLHLSELQMSGSMVRKYGFKNEEIGQVLRYLLCLVYDEPRLNTRESLTGILEELKVAHERKKTGEDSQTLPAGGGQAPPQADQPDGDPGDSGSERPEVHETVRTELSDG